MTSHHLHHDPAVDDMLRAANARAEAAEAERDEARRQADVNYQLAEDRSAWRSGYEEWQRNSRNWQARAEAAERRLAEQQAAVLALASRFNAGERAAGIAYRAGGDAHSAGQRQAFGFA